MDELNDNLPAGSGTCTNHFNQLTEAETERLAILAEECSEVIQVICKALRHGLESFNPKKQVPDDEFPETNRMMIERELGDLLHAMDRCSVARDLNGAQIEIRRKSKPASILPYLHHQAKD